MCNLKSLSCHMWSRWSVVLLFLLLLLVVGTCNAIRYGHQKSAKQHMSFTHKPSSLNIRSLKH